MDIMTHKMQLRFVMKKLILKIKSLAFPLSIIFLLFILYKRSPNQFLNPQMYAEDGNIFYNESQNGFLSSSMTPYNGFLYLFQRIAASISNLFTIAHVPFIYVMFSILAAVLLAYSVFRALDKYSTLQKIFACLSIGLGFYSTDVFNMLTNSHWYLGAALLLSILWHLPTHPIKRLIDKLFIFVMGLSGPFSMIYSPLYCIRIYSHRDFKKNWDYYSAWFIPSIIQVIVFVNTDREKNNLSIEKISQTSLSLAQWGKELMLSNFLILIVIMLASLYYILFNRKINDWLRTKSDIAFLAAGGLLILLSTMIMNLPLVSRYTFIPYLMATLIAFILFQNKIIIYLLTIVILSAQIFYFTKIGYYSNFNWPSYVALSQVMKRGAPLHVPINPEHLMPIGWSVNIISSGVKKDFQLDLLSPTQQKKLNFIRMHTKKEGHHLLFQATDDNPQIMYEVEGPCLRAHDLALEVQLTHSHSSPTQLFWSRTGDFSLEKSIKQVTHKNSNIYFAFKQKSGKSLKIRYDLTDKDSGELKKLILHCMIE